MGRGDDAHVDLARALGAHRAHHAVLEHAEELGLHGEAHLADLVEEERAPSATSKRPARDVTRP